MKDSKKSGLGFTLIEVLVFITIISVFFITALTVTVASLRNMQINVHKIVATKYAEELLDWIRSEKEENWKDFIESRMYTYCFNNSTISWPSVGACGASYTLGGIFAREATLLKLAGGNQVNIKVTVTWSEIGNTYSVPLETIISVWE